MHVHCPRFIRYNRARGERRPSLSENLVRSAWGESSPSSLTGPWRVSAPNARQHGSSLPPQWELRERERHKETERASVRENKRRRQVCQERSQHLFVNWPQDWPPITFTMISACWIWVWGPSPHSREQDYTLSWVPGGRVMKAILETACHHPLYHFG